MDNLTVELRRMLLQDLEGLWVRLLGNDNRAVWPHDTGFGFSNGLNAATCARQECCHKPCLKEGFAFTDAASRSQNLRHGL